MLSEIFSGFSASSVGNTSVLIGTVIMAFAVLASLI